MEALFTKPPAGGDKNYGPRYMTGVIVITVLAFLVVLLRMYVRIFINGRVGWDDWIMFGASVSTPFLRAVDPNEASRGD